MSSDERRLRNQAELASLLAEYFGEKLSMPEVERLVADTAAGLADRYAERNPSKDGLNVDREARE